MCHFLPVYHLGIAFLGRGEGQKEIKTEEKEHQKRRMDFEKGEQIY